MNLMKTNKILKSFFVMLLCIMTIPASAQKEEWNELFKNNLQLEKEIQSLIEDTIALHQTIYKFDEEQLCLNGQIDSIAKLCDELKSNVDNKKISSMQQKVDSLTDVVKKLLSRKNELNSINREKENTLSNLKRSLSSMGAYSAIKDEQMYSLYQEILSKPFSLITMENLIEIESKLNSFSTLHDFAEFKVRLSSCKRNKELYDAAEELLKVRYDENKIDQTRDKLCELLDLKKSDYRKGIIKLSETQYSEIDTLDIKLSRYGDGIKVLQNIVRSVNNSNVREQFQENKNACIEALRSIVFSGVKEDVENRKRFFDIIPSLNILYQKYWDELQANPFTYPTESESQIMQLTNE